MVRGYKPLAEAVAIVIIKVISLKCSLAGIINLALAYVYVGGMFNYTKIHYKAIMQIHKVMALGLVGMQACFFDNGFYIDSVLHYVHYLQC